VKNREYEIKIEKDLYIIDIGHDVIDIGELTRYDWSLIKELAKEALRVNATSEVLKAYIIAFVVYIAQRAEMAEPFDPTIDKIN